MPKARRTGKPSVGARQHTRAHKGQQSPVLGNSDNFARGPTKTTAGGDVGTLALAQAQTKPPSTEIVAMHLIEGVWPNRAVHPIQQPLTIRTLAEWGWQITASLSMCPFGHKRQRIAKAKLGGLGESNSANYKLPKRGLWMDMAQGRL